jgi:serine/threonine protein kinase
MGIVYKATDPHIQRTVALKTIQRRDAASSATGVANATRFRNEAQAAGRLSHPGIVSVYDYGEQGDESYIAMEYVQGPTLAECARRERLPLADVLSITSQLLDALQCAHGQNVWHRDIKPGNLILTVQGQLKVADFGIARIDANVLTQDAWSMGSPGYMAPECYTGAVIDHRVDLYACGVLLFELLTGARPFRGSPGVVMYQAMHEAPPTLAQALPGCDELAPFEVIVARAMAKQRNERFGSAHEMRGALHVVAQSIGLEIPQHISADTVRSLMTPVPMQHFQERPATTPAPLAVPPAPMPVKVAPATAPAVQAAAPVAAPVPPPHEVPDTHAVFVAELTRLLQPHLGPMAAAQPRWWRTWHMSCPIRTTAASSWRKRNACTPTPLRERPMPGPTPPAPQRCCPYWAPHRSVRRWWRMPSRYLCSNSGPSANCSCNAPLRPAPHARRFCMPWPMRRVIWWTATNSWPSSTSCRAEPHYLPHSLQRYLPHHCCSQGTPSLLPSIFIPGQFF